MNTTVNGYTASLSISIGRAQPGKTAGNTAAQTKEAAAALAKYMHQNGIDTQTPNGLYGLARNTSGQTPEDVSEAANFMLTHPDIYALLDPSGGDGTADVSSFDFAARGGYDAQLQDSAPESAVPMNEQAASGAIAAFMRQNHVPSIDPNTLFQLAKRPNSDTSPTVSAAAKFMLQNPESYRQIETNDGGAADGLSESDDFEAAAQGALSGLSSPRPAGGSTLQPLADQDRVAPVAPRAQQRSAPAEPPMDAQDASRILADHMLQGNASPLARLFKPQAMTPERLYQLAEGGKASPEVAAAAKFMLQNPDVYRAIETHDVPGADGKSGVGNLLAAARGEVPGVGGQASSALGNILQLLRQLLAQLQGPTGQPQPTQAQPMNGQSAARVLADHMVQEAGGALHLFGKRFLPKTQPMTSDRLYQLSQRQGKVAEAAKYMLQHPDTYRAIETRDVAGADGKSGLGNLLAAARGEIPAVKGATDSLDSLQKLLQQLLKLLKAHAEPNPPLDGQSAARVLADHMVQEAGGALHLFGKRFLPKTQPMTPDRLYQLSQGQGQVAEAAKYMLQHPDTYRAIETRDVAGADGKSGLGNLLAAARGEIPGVQGRSGGSAQALLPLLQLLLQLLKATSNTQPPLDGQSAAHTLADLLQQQGGSMTPDRLYQLSQGQGEIADAAKFMLKNPDIYRAIETHDVAGADGKSGLGNLLAAARGEIPGVEGGAAQRTAGASRSVLDALLQLLQLLTGQGTAQSNGASRPTRPAQPSQLDGQGAARILADHMLGCHAGLLAKAFGGKDMTPGRLYQLAESGTASPQVAAAAKFMLQNPDTYKAIETHDVPGADGRSGVGNLLAAARGEVPGVGGTPASSAGILQLLAQVLQGLQSREQQRVVQIEMRVSVSVQVSVKA
ncbi:hypothetical protein [Acidovorax sp. SUPP2539]|uniref:hypothetical protein n=1 Tax=Acidovorax sp. SUPP2539 TaxID=2920878 RepID=UPI0023DE3E58|nr:hypothetical protein [Acidovorax sp. SUPP2539]GKS91768.1 hypothetical protein AVTE2539_20405 [Acidovorax sp. SUPP2539]